MKKLIAGQLVAMVVALSGSTAFAGNVGVDFNIHLGDRVRTTSVGEYAYREPVRPPAVVSYPAIDGVTFVYREPLGFHVAVGVPYDLCYIDNSYYLFRDGRWLRAGSSRGPWVVQSYRDLPGGLRSHRIDRIRYYRDVRYEMPARYPERRQRDFYPAYRERHDCDTAVMRRF